MGAGREPDADGFDLTLGYRPQPRGKRAAAPIPTSPVETALDENRAPLADLPTKRTLPSRPADVVATPTAPPARHRHRRQAATALLCAGMALILLFSLTSMAAAPLSAHLPYVPVPAPEEPSPIQVVPVVERTPEPEPDPLVQIEVKNILQEPELPNGCETTSLAIVLQYLGYKVDKVDLDENYLPKQDFWSGVWGELYGPDPNDAYPGAPGPYALGYYCYPGVVVQMAATFIEANKGAHLAQDLTGTSARRLRALLDEGTPVIVWCTTDLEELRTTVEFNWYIAAGDDPYYPYVNMHAMVLTGYDDEYYYFCDPLDNHPKVERAVFEDNYIEVGRRAVALVEA